MALCVAHVVHCVFRRGCSGGLGVAVDGRLGPDRRGHARMVLRVLRDRDRAAVRDARNGDLLRRCRVFQLERAPFVDGVRPVLGRAAPDQCARERYRGRLALLRHVAGLSCVAAARVLEGFRRHHAHSRHDQYGPGAGRRTCRPRATPTSRGCGTSSIIRRLGGRGRLYTRYKRAKTPPLPTESLAEDSSWLYARTLK